MSAPTLLHRFETLPSTQDALHDLAQQGAPVGTAVVAGVQTLGRGSRGRGWESPLGGLWMSVLCRPEGELTMEVLSLRVALAVAEAVECAHPGTALQLKWPNDLMLGGRKLGGILCEARWHGANLGWVAVGVGLNVANPIPAAVATTAIALGTMETGAAPARLAEPIAEAVAGAARRQGLLEPAELAEFRARDWLAGRRIVAPGQGTAEGITAHGALLVRGPGGTLDGYRSGTVLLAGEAAPAR